MPSSSLPLPTLSSAGSQALDALIKDAIEQDKLPATFLAAANAEKVIYENQGGYVDYPNKDRKVDGETTLHMFSMTKFVTSIACHQLVDKQLISLDDPAVIAQHLPEVTSMQILEGYDGDTPRLRPVTTPITLAMLLSHSSGMAYAWPTQPSLVKWRQQSGKGDYFANRSKDPEAYVQPLVFEPGTSYTYGIGIDWAGFLIERVTGKSLEEYFKQNIFEPCGMSSTTFFPTDDIKRRLMTCCTLDASSGEEKLAPIQPPGSMPLGKPSKPEDVKVLSGGGGLYGKIRDYLKMLQAVLRSSPDYEPQQPGGGSGVKLLSSESFKRLFVPVLQTQVARENLATMMTDQWYHSIAPTASSVQHSAALALYLEDSSYGRKAGSGCWDGAAKTIFWIDPKSGLVAECNTNILSVGNENAVGRMMKAFEETLYKHLE